MKDLMLAASVLFLSSCSSEPSGWTLWKHTFAWKGDLWSNERRTFDDGWSPYASYSKLTECKNEISLELARLVKAYEEDSKKGSPEDNDVHKEQDGLRVVAPSKKRMILKHGCKNFSACL